MGYIDLHHSNPDEGNHTPGSGELFRTNILRVGSGRSYLKSLYRDFLKNPIREFQEMTAPTPPPHGMRDGLSRMQLT